MADKVRGVSRGTVNGNEDFSGKPSPGAVSPRVKVGNDGPLKSAGLTGAPLSPRAPKPWPSAKR